MSYEKQNWKSGDVVTSAKLNHMEDGIAAGGMAFVEVTATYSDETGWVYETDASYNDLKALTLAGKTIMMTWVEHSEWQDPAGESDEIYYAPVTYLYASISDAGEEHAEEYNVSVGNQSFNIGAYDPDAPLSSTYAD